MRFRSFIFIVLHISRVINGQAFTFSPIVGTMDISTCGNVYQKNTTDTQRTESYSFPSILFYENITFSTCGSTFDTTLRLYKYDIGAWTDLIFADDDGSCSPQTEMVISNLGPGDYVLELASFNHNYFGFYTITTQNCILGSVQTSAAPTPATTDTETTPPTPAETTSSPIATESGNDSGYTDNSEAGVSMDLLMQVCIGLAVYALVPCIFYCVKSTCCKEEEDENTATTDATDSLENEHSRPNILKSYLISMIDIFDCSTDIISGYNFFFIKGCGILDCKSENLSSFDAYGYIFIICGSIAAVVTVLKNILLYYQIKNKDNNDETIIMKMKILGDRLEATKILLCDIPIAGCFIVLLLINNYDLGFSAKISLSITFFDLLVLTIFYCQQHIHTSQQRMQSKMSQQIDENGQVVYTINNDAAGVLRAQMCQMNYVLYFVLILTVFILGLNLAYAWFDITKSLAPKMMTINDICYSEDGTFGSYDQDGYSISTSWWSWHLELEVGTKPGLYGGTDPCLDVELDYGKCLNVDPSQYSNCSSMGTSPIEICVDRCTLVD